MTPNTPPLHVMLVSPRIPQNVGTIGRLCAATGCSLHIVRPIPFVLGDKELRRAGMDYWEQVDLTVHDCWPAAQQWLAGRRIWLLTSRGSRSTHDAAFAPGDALLFGSESHGAPAAVHEYAGADRELRIPMPNPDARCLNVAVSAGIAVYEALRQTGALAEVRTP